MSGKFAISITLTVRKICIHFIHFSNINIVINDKYGKYTKNIHQFLYLISYLYISIHLYITPNYFYKNYNINRAKQKTSKII